MINIAIMAFNLLPLPMLDGGHILLALIEAVRRQAISARAYLRFQKVGLVVIGTLFVLILANDPLRLRAAPARHRPDNCTRGEAGCPGHPLVAPPARPREARVAEGTGDAGGSQPGAAMSRRPRVVCTAATRRAARLLDHGRARGVGAQPELPDRAQDRRRGPVRRAASTSPRRS